MNDEIELRHLRYFLAVAETLHFSKAAQRLGIAQPPLSQQIKRLESLLGHPLFDRTTRGVKLTRAGQLLAQRARSTIEKVDDDLAQVRRLGRGEAGTLTVGFSGSVMFTDLPAAIESYQRRYPKVELRLREMATSAQIISLLDGTLDLGFLRDGDPTGGLYLKPLLKERFVAVLPASHPLARKASVRVRISGTSHLSSLPAAWAARVRPNHWLLRTQRLSSQHCPGCAAMAHSGSAGSRRAWCFHCARLRRQCRDSGSGLSQHSGRLSHDSRFGNQSRIRKSSRQKFRGYCTRAPLDMIMNVRRTSIDGSIDRKISRRAFAGFMAAAPFAIPARAEEWVDLFDGHSLNGWRPSENKASWKVVDGALTANGPRSHLFYNGPIHQADFRNFELEVELVTQPGCNSGVYFHTEYQETGFPEKGFEIQVNNTAHGDHGYLERKRTASLYGIRNMYKQLVPDQQPFRIRIAVRGKNVQIRLNDQLVVDYVEPTPPVIPEGGEHQRFLDHGTFALQCHNDGSKVAYRKVRVRPLSDNLAAYTGAPPVADGTYRDIINIGRHNVPMVDYDVYLRNGMTLEQALRKSRADGIQYGLTVASTTVKNDAGAHRWLASLAHKPVFFGLYAADHNWTRAISRATAQQFDYVLADDRSWADKKNHALTNRQQFLDALVDQTVERLNSEPIDIYAFPTYLPPSIKAEANQLWTDPRMARIIDALLKNQVAIELNTREQLPSRAFVEQAKEAGCKFGFGTANETTAELKRCEYGLQMVGSCKLDWHNFYAPGAWWPKAADRRWKT